ncbi:class I SAM-dependent methyltransferase [Negadavirga shengliensis]|uniref:Class I SAM-dependent methyltransferase n=1 Tax=Negadavirga shengliensis TaxID=1389218 RepID=A0ABV9SVX0_9BACT
MKRIQLFEFEDQAWFPDWIRVMMTQYMMAFHRILKTSDSLLPLVKKALASSEKPVILDLCSGSGGPMVEVYEKLRASGDFGKLRLVLSDLYPNQFAVEEFNERRGERITYHREPLDASRVPLDLKGVRTMVSSMHHMKPELARRILRNARDAGQPLLVFEISDNSAPRFLWWLAIPVAFLTSFFVTPLVRPLTLQQLLFTYLIPILPVFIAWDGAVSNARTYTMDDMDYLLQGVSSEHYLWETGKIKGKGGNKLYLLGRPRPVDT